MTEDEEFKLLEKKIGVSNKNKTLEGFIESEVDRMNFNMEQAYAATARPAGYAYPLENKESDPVNHPPHYTNHPSGVECIQITEHMGFCLGNAVKYIWRADLKADAIEDLKKARWYIDREIALRSKK
jgi:hypothetical protein